MYGESNDMPLCQEFHYEWVMRTMYLLNVVVVDPTRKTMVMSVISRPTGATMELNLKAFYTCES
jgi:hypothetical protein